MMYSYAAALRGAGRYWPEASPLRPRVNFEMDDNALSHEADATAQAVYAAIRANPN